ncbi:MAG: hypothetical protein PPP58_10155 [Natronomonas sp.]
MGHIRRGVSTLLSYPRSLASSYRDGGVSEVATDIREHLWWRWYRLRMHPQFRPIYTRFNRVGHRLLPAHFTDADPFETIHVDPANVESVAVGLPSVWGRVIGGDWERRPFDDEAAYRAAKERFLDGTPWTEIDRTVADPEVYERLYESIERHGYRSQAELSETAGLSGRRDCEIGVAIDRDGSILWVKRGFHRLTIAKLLEIESIPVQVRVRHPAWQAIRDEVRAADTHRLLSSPAIRHLDHPDLEDLTE